MISANFSLQNEICAMFVFLFFQGLDNMGKNVIVDVAELPHPPGWDS